MSVEMIGVVLHHSKARGTDKLVLIGIANHHDLDGSWPGMKLLAKYANVSIEAVRRSVRNLEALGELETSTSSGGSAHTPTNRRPNLYRILLKCPEGCEGWVHEVRPLQDVGPRTGGVSGIRARQMDSDPTQTWAHGSVGPRRAPLNRSTTSRKRSEEKVSMGVQGVLKLIEDSWAGVSLSELVAKSGMEREEVWDIVTERCVLVNGKWKLKTTKKLIRRTS